MKIKGYRFPCEVCGDNKVVCSVQVFSRKNGEVSYARARHYGSDKKFYYHQQSLEYVNRKLREIAIIDPCQESDTKHIAPKEPELNSKFKNKAFQYLVAGRVGFEPTTSSLEGWLAIRAATSAQQSQK
jgi:hypothetical protein